MSFVLELENFQGPFDLLLELLKNQKLDIADISLAKITQDYLDYISRLNLDIEEMSTFLYVAAKLVLSKSKALVNADVSEENFDLTESLKQYQTVKNQANFLLGLSSNPLTSKTSPSRRKSGPVLINNLDIKNTYQEILRSNSNKPKLQHIKTDQQQVAKIRNDFINNIAKLKSFTMNEAMTETKSKKEATIYFITILELIKNGRLRLLKNYIEVGAIA